MQKNMDPREALKIVLSGRGELAQAEVARGAGMTPPELNRYLKGTSRLRDDRFTRVLLALPMQAQIEFLFLLNNKAGMATGEALASTAPIAA
jgi:hypothetical protein